uniref:Uncharacterized protein n=1 Tax=Arundo donax TaxID=35708 RepID=A0A0A9HAV3_ARUDO
MSRTRSSCSMKCRRVVCSLCR